MEQVERYKTDEDIPDSVWNNYLKKYDKDYILFLAGERIWKIKCKYGQIEPYSLKGRSLSYYGQFPTSGKKTALIKRATGLGAIVRQLGDLEVVLTFYEDSMREFSGTFKIRKRMRLSDAQRKAKSDSMRSRMVKKC